MKQNKQKSFLVKNNHPEMKANLNGTEQTHKVKLTGRWDTGERLLLSSNQCGPFQR